MSVQVFVCLCVICFYLYVENWYCHYAFTIVKNKNVYMRVLIQKKRIHLAQIIFEFWVVYGQYIIDVPVRLNRDTKCFFPVESKDCMKSTSYEYRQMSARSGAQFVPIGMPEDCWKTFPAKTTKILSARNSSILMMSSSEYILVFRIRVSLHQICIFMP